jgi:hypothetical protein
MGMSVLVKAIDESQLREIPADPDSVEEILDQTTSDGTSVSLEKAWHGLHYLLTGTADAGPVPLNFLLRGGEPIGEDQGYGPARLFRPAAVQALATSIGGVTDGQLWSRFDPDRMTAEGIYPLIWDEPEPDLRDEYLTYFRELQALIQTASRKDMGLVVLLH